MESRTVHFTITGEALTRIVRDIFLSGRPDKAYQAVLRSLGENDERVPVLAQRLLSGTVRLEGVDDLEVVDENPPTPECVEFRQRADYLYGGCVRIGERWYQPHAIVTSLGSVDGEYACKRAGDKPNGYNQAMFQTFRAEFYGDENDKAVSVAGYQYPVLFREVGAPPMWRKTPNTPAEAVKEALRCGHTLQERGYTIEVGNGGIDPETRTPTFDRMAREELAAQREEARERAEKVLVEGWRRKILEQAGTDFIDLVDINGVKHGSVPRAPFVRWALARTNLSELSPKWESVCPQGMKLNGDNSDHTDWWVGGGGDPSKGYPYGEGIDKAAHYTRAMLQEEMGDYKVAVINRGFNPITPGTVGKEILVLPNLHPDYFEQAIRSRGIITEAGGAMAHLAQVAGEYGIPILLVENARKLFPEGARVILDTNRGRITTPCVEDPTPSLEGVTDGEQN